jgi:hypothetical protein
MAMASAAPKRMAPAKKSAPKKKKPAAPAKKASPAAKKPAPAKKPAAAPAAMVPRLATPLPAGGQAAKPPPQPAARPAAAASAASSADEKRRAATRRFFARLRSLEAIIGADLRKRGSVVLMQAVDQWYSEAISATATDVSITNAAKAVIAHL